MATVTKPPVKTKLSPKDEACHRLVRLLMRAYYEKEHHAVIDCLLELQLKLQNKVTESDLSGALHLSPKLIREILHRMRTDQLVKGVQKSEVKAVEELTSRGKRKSYTRQPTVTFTWYIDFEQVVNVIKFRHWDIFEKLNKKVDKSEVYYICPTLDCENHALSRKRSVMDLLLDPSAHKDGIFRCELCFTHNPLLNTKHATPLVLLTHSESASSSVAAAASGSNGSLGIDPNENLKNKFNKQLGVILEQLMKVDRMLQEEIQAAKEAAVAGVSVTAAATEAVTSGVIQFVNPAALAAAASSVQAAASAAANGTINNATATAAVLSAAAMVPQQQQQQQQQQQSVEDMIHVDLANDQQQAGGDAKRIKMDHVISALSARDALLPWDKKNPLSLAKVEEEKKLQESIQQRQHSEEQRLKAEEEERRFQAQFAEQLQKQQEAQAAALAEAQAAAAQAEAERLAHAQQTFEQQDGEMMNIDMDQSSGPTVLVGGRPVLVASLTQDEIDQMTPEEFEAYSRDYGETEEF